jgi:hypothetical protein
MLSAITSKVGALEFQERMEVVRRNSSEEAAITGGILLGSILVGGILAAVQPKKPWYKF